MIDRYNGTTKEQRKMARAVAADVLKTLKLYRLTQWAYCDTSGKYELTGKDIKSLPAEEIKHCKVCARGAMLISRARLLNDYKLPNYSDQSCYVLKNTARDFGKFNAFLIENAYQQEQRAFPRMAGDKSIIAAAEKFGKKYRSDRGRFKAIMENVVANKGVFRPDKPVIK